MKTLTLLTMALAMLFSLFLVSPVQAGTSFNDTDAVEVERLAADEIVRGMAPGQFAPQSNVTRGEAAAMIRRSLDMNAGGSAPFPDTNGHWAEGDIAVMAAAGIIGGHEDGQFRPDGELRREEMAAILTRSFNYESRQSSFFTDVSPSHFFYNNITTLGRSGIANGYPDGSFGPGRNINRLEFSLMLARTLYPEYVPEVDSVSLEDSIGTGVVINSDTLNVRPDPSTQYSSIGRLYRGDEVQIHDRTGNWALISNDSIRGYVSMHYLNMSLNPGEGGGLEGRTIMIDPGHGGSDPGAVANGVVEKEINLDVSLRLEQKLQAAGAEVLMTRRGDWFPSLQDRVRQANSSNADIFISVHANAAGATAARGSETFYNTTYWAGNSQTLAETLQSQMLDKLNTVDRGVKRANFYVIRNTRIPSALIELGFMTNAQEAARMRTDAFREASAEALYEGIIDYYDRRS
ncbi:N-acetylmuramoyl-L-alanine amidase [Alkalicoccus chagannorensis]|uniref:N-acetylmuramoyl-L-alanine amidase n=1 Tax=Alkalicoccus chagannorensis TaxID=427072 RepID=UPI000404676F|nr:N-acetylmuramoyl-L-alanine amidase [Alkalicoccus chagannorensis]